MNSQKVGEYKHLKMIKELNLEHHINFHLSYFYYFYLNFFYNNYILIYYNFNINYCLINSITNQFLYK